MITVFPDFTETKAPKYHSLQSVYSAIKGSGSIRDQILTLRAETDEKEQDRLKKKLPCILFSGKFSERDEKCFNLHSGLAVIDFDSKETKGYKVANPDAWMSRHPGTSLIDPVSEPGKKVQDGKALIVTDAAALRDSLKQYPFVVMAFVSPRGNGVKALVKIPASIPEHRGRYKAIINFFEALDTTSINPSRICFASYDEDAWMREPIECDEFEGYVVPDEVPPPPIQSATTDYSKIVISVNMIRNAVHGEKHDVINKAAFLAGGLTASGWMVEEEALRILELEIRNKPGLNDINGHLKTMREGFEAGKLKPTREQNTGDTIQPKTKTTSGIIRLSSVREKMLHQYKNGKERGKTTHFPTLDQHFTWKRTDLTLWSGVPNCFIGTTLVNTKEGHLPISEIQVGMEVLSFNHETKKYEYRKVLRTLIRGISLIKQNMITFVLHAGERITCTEKHKFYDGVEYVPAFVIAQRAVEGSRKYGRSLLYIDTRKTVNDRMERAQYCSSDETCEGHEWIFANDDKTIRGNSYSQDASYSGANVSTKSRKYGRCEPQKRAKGRQSFGEFGVGDEESESKTWFPDGLNIFGGREKSSSETNGRSDSGNSGEVRTICISVNETGERVRSLRGYNKNDSKAKNLDPCDIAEIIYHTPTEDVYDLTVEGNHNYTVGLGNYHVHNSGKSAFIMFLMLLRSVFDGDKWAVFSPESYPADEFYDMLIEMMVGMSVDPYYASNQMSIRNYEEAMDFIEKHFFFVYPDVSHTITEIESEFTYAIRELGVTGCLIDPHNQLTHMLNGQRDDQYLDTYLTSRKRFAIDNDVYYVIICHPKPVSKNSDGEYEAVDIYNLAGGAMWANKVDNFGVTRRPHQSKNPKDNLVEIIIRKIKKQKLVGIPGTVSMTYDRRTARYYDETGYTPLDKIRSTPAKTPIIKTDNIEDVEYDMVVDNDDELRMKAEAEPAPPDSFPKNASSFFSNTQENEHDPIPF